MVNITPHCFTPRKEPRYPLNRRLGGPQSQNGRLEIDKNHLLLPHFKPQIVQLIPKYDQQDAKLHSFYFCKLLYTFWVDPPPVIRSITLYLQHQVFVKLLLLPVAIVEELKL